MDNNLQHVVHHHVTKCSYFIQNVINIYTDIKAVLIKFNEIHMNAQVKSNISVYCQMAKTAAPFIS